ncbi:hypothetical protein LCGC14_1042740 [marine sediment metagenome]|uniref:Uncharacterized protein n=2 Tax=root TaxID=1 RepID=A0A831QN43_9FLAO|nr:hypothetical protein [Pricia antarctica]
MSTATAHRPRPIGNQTQEVNVKLVQALPEDFREVASWKDGKPVYVRRMGMIYWLYSFAKNEMEPTPYIITDATCPEQMKEFLDNKMVFIARNPFKD